MRRCPSAALAAWAFLSLGAPLARACSVCQGDPNSDLVQGAKSGVLAMVVITYSLLLGFAGAAVTWFVRARRVQRRAAPGEEA